MGKSAAAKHSADYRARQAILKERMGIQKMHVEVPIGTRSQMETAMKDHGYSQIQELWQDLALSFLASPREEQAQRLRKPDAAAFVITPKLARQYQEQVEALLRSDPRDNAVDQAGRPLLQC